MITIHPNIKAIEKRFINLILGSLSILFFLLYIISKYIQIFSDLLEDCQNIYLFSSFTALISCVLLNSAKYNFKKVMLLMSVFFIVYIIIINLSLNYITLFSYSFIFPAAFMIHTVTDKKKVISASLLLMAFFICFSYLLDNNYEKKSTLIVYGLSLLTIVINSYFSLIIIKFSKDLISDYNSDDPLEIVPDPKLAQLFEEIMNYVVKEKGYRNSDINKRQLAKELKTNHTYLSKALNVIGNITFTTLVNENALSMLPKKLLITAIKNSQ